MKLISLKRIFLTASFIAGIATSPLAAQEPVKIGMITTLSGPAGYLGQDLRDGFQLAIDMEGGKLGGIPVQLIVEDDSQKPTNGRQIAERMMHEENVHIFTGIVFSNIAGATVPDIVDNGNFFISANAAPSNFAGKECHENYFVVNWQNDSLHEGGGELANQLGYKRVFLLASNYQSGKDGIAGFKRFFKGEIVGETYTRLDQTDFSAEIAQIRNTKPDVVYQIHSGGLGITFLRQYQQAGLLDTIPMLVSEPSLDTVTLKAVGDAAIGLKMALHWNSDFDNPANKAFVEAWNKKYKRPSTFYADQGYETALVIAAALKDTKGNIKDEDAFREALRNVKINSTRGEFHFDKNQHPIQNWYAAEVVKGVDGQPQIKTGAIIFSNKGDSYASQCKL
ncbi:ABC transporter substrate-binding protein [Bartonella sp. HY329]|uniref:ABC transporter substrate-binding protein n=1 Tax=unclassified Bartonella TaxID=2645622 RepID=UPI0021C807E2|nr:MULTISPECIES: ABC transporter substrate-binding protein [unclassified Bartonella]UXM95080.1 ABC transporter substrate-binding protein [Bartonella sp. HY329]UXN09403.1 ABC transporter substrate-binding protein [Bartonella sp. HY328]